MTAKLNILVFQPDFSRYEGAYYQHQFTQALGRVHRIFRYGPRLEGYDSHHSIVDVLKLCPFQPDLICFAAGWDIDNPSLPKFDVSNLDIPTVKILDHEYEKMEQKFLFIQDNGVKLVFTSHHHYLQWQKETEVPFVHFPFAIAPALFNDYSERKRYALGFSGSLLKQWTDTRSRIKDHIFLRWPIKTRRYWSTRLFWYDDSMIPTRRLYRFRGGYRLSKILRVTLPTGKDYARLINRSKIWLSTPSAVDLVGTRFYEIMASRTLLFCSDSPAYEGLFEDGVHCVTFNPDLSDFDDKLFHYLRNEDERQEIVERGYAHVMENHTWDRRIEQFTDAVRKVAL